MSEYETKGANAVTELNNRDLEPESFDEDTLLDEAENDDQQDERRSFRYDPDEINIITRQPTIEQLLRRIDQKALNLAPKFQRQADIWKPDVKSRLIESILIRIPLPAFYVDATDEDNWLVVDGLQRLFALKEFVNDNKLTLSGLEYLNNLEGKRYEQLIPRYQRRILETQPTVYLIQSGTPPEVKYNIFKRINTGGTPLSPQEIRHALNPGQATEFLAELAKMQEFKQIVDLSDSKKSRMDDREFVLGFLAYTLTSYKNYEEGNRDEFLSEALFKINKLTNQELASIKDKFKKAMIAANEIFGENAFRKLSNKNQRKYPLNKAIFEVWSVNLGKLGDKEIQKLKNKKQEIIDSFRNYINNDKEFNSSISQAANKVDYRFTTVEKIIQDVLS
ncbi:MAG: DUF262 domain-containing protein [Coleofasciculus sp. B1-GNL1-01]|uniref:DUF262 domain-containing protein n=1 Tax=Coleofasciculus sp. B1-GNL1-01 TaxID=3068484 RepID=UPI0032F6531B